MRAILIALIALLLVLQYRLWFGQGGVTTILHLKHQITAQKRENHVLKQRNAVLIADIEDLKKGNEAAEERARNDLGMIKKNETFYRTVPGS